MWHVTKNNKYNQNNIRILKLTQNKKQNKPCKFLNLYLAPACETTWNPIHPSYIVTLDMYILVENQHTLYVT